MKPKRRVHANPEARSLARVYDPAIFSLSDIMVNRMLDVVEAWVDRYLVTPLFGRDLSAAA